MTQSPIQRCGENLFFVNNTGFNRSLKVFPNPYNDYTNIIYELPVDKKVKAEIYNVIGKRVCVLVNEMQTKGKYKYQFNAKEFGYPEGLYLLLFEVDGKREFRKLTELK